MSWFLLVMITRRYGRMESRVPAQSGKTVRVLKSSWRTRHIFIYRFTSSIVYFDSLPCSIIGALKGAHNRKKKGNQHKPSPGNCFGRAMKTWDRNCPFNRGECLPDG